MNRFSDGFSDKSYEDLLNEYAGESLGNKSRQTDTKSSAASGQRSQPIRRTSQSASSVAPIQRGTSVRRRSNNSTVAPVRRTSSQASAKPNFKVDIPNTKTFSEKADAFKPLKSFEDEQRSDKRTETKNTVDSTMEFNKSRLNSQKKFEPVIEKKNVAVKSKLNFNSKFGSKLNFVEKLKQKFSADPQLSLRENLLLAFKSNWKSFVVFACCFIVAGIITAVALSCVNDVLAIKYDDDTVVEVVLPNDANTDIAIDVLKDADLIENKWFCKLFIKAMGYTDKNYLPGVYYFNKTMGVEKMITRFKVSNVRGAVISITIPEGYTIDQIFERLEKNEICSSSSLYKTIDEVDFSDEYDFINELQYKENRYHVLEGYMFPATYEFEQGSDPATVIRKFLDAFKVRWTDEYAERAAELGLTTDDIIKIASIIEKEASGSGQFPLVSSVLHNRLNRSGLYPTLDCDSTKDYVSNTISKRITNVNKIDSYISNYSTYECAGLPVGAICNPGIAAIEAALYPDTTQYYFFAHDKNKTIYMAKNIEEHGANLKVITRINAED